MNPKRAWLLVALALTMFAYIMLVERRQGTESVRPLRLLACSPQDVVGVRVLWTNQPVVEVQRGDGQSWQVIAPVSYPAESYAVENLLSELSEIPVLTTVETGAGHESAPTLQEFGLDPPQATLIIRYRSVVLTATRKPDLGPEVERNPQTERGPSESDTPQANRSGGQKADSAGSQVSFLRQELRFGSRTVDGAYVYVQQVGRPGVAVVPVSLFGKVPRHLDDWQTHALADLGGLQPRQIEVRLPNRSYVVGVNPTNRQLMLLKPFPSRVAMPSLQAILDAVQNARVMRFVSDDPAVNPEPFGLDQPAAELILHLGEGSPLYVQFGRSPTNDSSLVYARRAPESNIVLVAARALETVQHNARALRDLHLFTFDPGALDVIEVSGAEAFRILRQPDGSWQIPGQSPTPVDRAVMKELLEFFSDIQGEVEKDVVTDFSPYGLTNFIARYRLIDVQTNAQGAPVERVLSELHLGIRQGDKVFVRRPDEPSTVYAIGLSQAERFPVAAWQLRDRQIWSFTPDEVVRVVIRQHGRTRTLVRLGTRKWTLGAGSQGIITDVSKLEDSVAKLGQLRADLWVARGDTNRTVYGFRPDGHKITFELKRGDKLESRELEIGGRATSFAPYALTRIEGETWIFQLPIELYFVVVRDLSLLPKPESGGSTPAAPSSNPPEANPGQSRP